MLLNILLLIVFVAVIAFCFAGGLWGNAIRLVNVVTGALLAMNYFEPLAAWLQGFLPSYPYLADFVALWLVFSAATGVLAGVTDLVWKEPVHFPPLVDRIGSGLMVAWVGWVMVSFTLTTLHTAPLARNFLDEAFQPEQQMFFGTAPDRKWLAFTQKVSEGVYAGATFDPQGEYMVKYAIRRSDLELHAKTTGTLRTQ